LFNYHLQVPRCASNFRVMLYIGTPCTGQLESSLTSQSQTLPTAALCMYWDVLLSSIMELTQAHLFEAIN